METEPQEVSSDPFYPRLLLYRNSGAAIDCPQFPCEHIYLDIPSKLGSSWITAFKGYSATINSAKMYSVSYTQTPKSS